jgi:hypothetical protein
VAVNKYPRIGSKRPAHGGTCDICKMEPVVIRVDVEENYFRGDDEVFRLGETCKRLSAGELLAKRRSI